MIDNSSIVNVGDIPARGMNPTLVMEEVEYHSYSTPNFSLETKLLELYPELKENYVLKAQSINYGKDNGRNHKCTNCKKKIKTFAPLYRLTKIEKPEEFSERKYFRTWLFGNEECLKEWLNEHNPEWML